jgi:hypothetical protein
MPGQPSTPLLAEHPGLLDDLSDALWGTHHCGVAAVVVLGSGLPTFLEPIRDPGNIERTADG